MSARKGIYGKFRKQLREIRDYSLASYMKRPTFSMSGNKEFFAEGIITVEVYNKDNISFCATDVNVDIRGRNLSMCFYSRTTVKISGYIQSISFGCEKEKVMSNE